MPKSKKVDIIVASLSDHHAIKANFLLPYTKQKAPRWRFNTTLISNNEFCFQFKSKLSEFLSFNKDSVEDFRFIWEATKGFIKDNVTSFASFQNRSRQLLSWRNSWHPWKEHNRTPLLLYEQVNLVW